MLPRKLFAEALGTFALLFVGMLSITNNAGLLGVALAHGLAVGVMIMALGKVSGGHFNPAVSVGMSLAGKQDLKTTLAYVGAQLLGAVLGALAAVGVAGTNAALYGVTRVAPSVPAWSAAFGELIVTFFLVLVVIKVAAERRHALGGLIIGLTITVGILAVGPESGAALNPARAFGSALIGENWANHWVYWVGPLLGGALAAGASRVLKDDPEA
ncbi:aquaporin Z [Deinococcus reticulitermitis]|uniref:Aquaporin Z n=1 Tax=Deinococcus reticulitermitis TaxID=856736 RepID=A0A1H6X3A3_9DEIO|nr:aquaporin [Deinococcus reticulitermitis]SEJ23621.1 aquaporin Z [Deinococcus reticulitermitis]